MRREVRAAPRKVSVFFFQHPLAGRNTPGRFPYGASADAVDLDAGTCRPWTGTIYADGFGADTPGPNIDPHVFSEVLPWHLSFCRLSDDASSNLVAGASRSEVLSKLVKRGDVIIFGNAFRLNVVWVDTVICVHGRATIPSEGGQFVIEDQFERYWQDVSEFEPEMTWERFKRVRDYRLNLIDAIPPDGRHTTTAVVPHSQIIGRRRGEAGPNDRTSILTRILAGDGFNFIPLRATDALLLTDNQQERDRPGLLTFEFELKRQLDSVENEVHLLAEDLGKRLLDAILRAAKDLVLDPIRPLAPALR